MAGVSKRVKQLRESLKKARAKNPRHHSVLRSGKKRVSIVQSTRPPADSKPTPEAPRTPVKASNTFGKTKKQRKQEIARLSTIKRMLNRRNSSPEMASQREGVPSTSSAVPVSPQKWLAALSVGRVSQKGLRNLNKLHQVQHGGPIVTPYSLDKAKDTLNSFCDFQRSQQGAIQLVSIQSFLEERKKRSNLDQVEGPDVLISGDSGAGTFVFTIALLDSPAPQSHRNHGILSCWDGSDKREKLEDNDLKSTFNFICTLNVQPFLGGDYSFLATVSGLSCGMSYSCIKCSIFFDKSRKADVNIIPMVQFHDRRTDEAKMEIYASGFSQQKDKIINIDEDFIVPPILHFKIHIGNGLRKILEENVDDKEAFMNVLKKCKLDVDRKAQKQIYSVFNGKDVRRFCESIQHFKGISGNSKYRLGLEAVESLAIWSNLVSTTKRGLTEKECAAISCKVHHVSPICCATSNLATKLQDVGGFGQKVLIHFVLSHLGQFVWQHRFIGAGCEEGIEALHPQIQKARRIHKTDRKSQLQRAAADHNREVLMFDGGKYNNL